ncbi:MAG: hypothetical protein GEV11_00410 [Streptosporangiales bacterium]|nr:hypothetical protein [Streptosporangiales bacterium]
MRMICAFALVSGLMLAGCGNSGPTAAEVSDATAKAGTKALQFSGHLPKGPLRCATPAAPSGTMTVRCTGTTKDGEPITVAARLSKLTAERPTEELAISVDGEEVLRRWCVTTCPQPTSTGTGKPR